MLNPTFETALGFMAQSDAETAKDILSLDMPLALLVAESGQGFLIVPDVTGIGDNSALGAALRPFAQILSRMEGHSLSDADKAEMIEALNDRFDLGDDMDEPDNGIAALKSAVSNALSGGADITTLLEAFTEAATERV